MLHVSQRISHYLKNGPGEKWGGRPHPLAPPLPAPLPKVYFLTPPPTVEHPERRHWHTVDTDMDESDSDESEREYPDNTDLDESVSDKSERERPDDTDVEGTDLSKTEMEKQMILMYTNVMQVKTTKTKTKTRTITGHSSPGTNLRIHKELQYSKRFISETPAQIDLINVYI